LGVMRDGSMSSRHPAVTLDPSMKRPLGVNWLWT
jgi:hypothetical protein